MFLPTFSVLWFEWRSAISASFFFFCHLLLMKTFVIFSGQLHWFNSSCWGSVSTGSEEVAGWAIQAYWTSDSRALRTWPCLCGWCLPRAQEAKSCCLKNLALIYLDSLCCFLSFSLALKLHSCTFSLSLWLNMNFDSFLFVPRLQNILRLFWKFLLCKDLVKFSIKRTSFPQFCL